MAHLGILFKYNEQFNLVASGLVLEIKSPFRNQQDLIAGVFGLG